MDTNIEKREDTSLAHILKLAAPVTMQNMIASSLGFIDVLMIGTLGKVSITAVGICNQYFFIYFLAIFGISSGSQIYLAQYWGDKNIKNFHKAMGVAVLPSLFFLLIFFVPVFFFPKFVLSLFTSDTEVIKQGLVYFKVVCLSYPFHIVLQILSIAFRASKKPSVPMIISAISLGLNTGLNYLLILGNYGFPRLGVRGAAIATLTSTFIALIISILFVFFTDNPIRAKISDYFNFDKKFFKMILFAAMPIALNELLWSLGSALFGMSFSRYSTAAYASYQIFNLIYGLIFSFGIGLAISDTIILGNLLGEGRLEEARKLERKFTKITFVVSVISGVLIFFLAPYFVMLFKVSDYIAYNVEMMIKVDAFFIPLKFYTLLHILGTLRAGDDSISGIIIDIGTMFLMGVPLAFISLHYFNLPLYLVIACISSEEILKSLFCYLRVKQGKWVKNLVS